MCRAVCTGLSVCVWLCAVWAGSVFVGQSVRIYKEVGEECFVCRSVCLWLPVSRHPQVCISPTPLVAAGRGDLQ